MKALVTGASSQDASYLIELLLEKGYDVYGLLRRSASQNLWRIADIKDKITVFQGDLTDQTSLDNAVKESNPDEVYNLGAQSFVQYSFQAPATTCDITGLGALRLFESVKNYAPKAKVFQASSSEMYGKIQETPQTEKTKFYPRSPYGAAKAFAHHLAVNYREAYGLHISCAIMFNHESPRRGEEFVTRKITKGIADYRVTGKKISLGNLNASRDWGHAKDFMRGAWLMLQQETPDDYVLATGETHTVKQWLEKTCEVAGVDFWDCYTQNPTFQRQAEVDYLRGDYTKAKKVLGWEPTITFDQLIEEMYNADYLKASGGANVIPTGR